MAFILGILNLFLTLIGIVSLPPAIIHARRAAMQVQCASNLRQLAMVQLMYASANKGSLPANFDDLAAAAGAYTRPGSTIGLFVCPECAADATKKPATVGTKVNSSYIFLFPAAKFAKLHGATAPHRQVIANEPLTNHDNRGSNFLFLDGHCAWLPAADAKKAIAELTAGQNPPPSIR